MKTKKVLIAAAFAAVTLLSGYNYVQNNSEVKLSDLALANVEALASGEGGDCRNVNGYKSWKTSSIWGGQREFYDCCYNLRSGYSPEGTCI